MSILITGVEMPTEDLILSIDIFPDGTVEDHWISTISGARAVQLPPHGDLIGRNPLIDIVMHLRNQAKGEEAKKLLGSVVRHIAESPAIIPAERGTP